MSLMSLLVTWVSPDNKQYEIGGLDAEAWECFRIFEVIENESNAKTFLIFLLDSEGFVLGSKTLSESTVNKLFPGVTTEELIASGVEIDIEFIPEPEKE